MNCQELNIKTTPYVYNMDEYGKDASHAQPMSCDDLNAILASASSVDYFTDDDATDGGIIEVACEAFGKLLPENNGYDMRDYHAFFFTNEEAEYAVLMLDEWPNI